MTGVLSVTAFVAAGALSAAAAFAVCFLLVRLVRIIRGRLRRPGRCRRGSALSGSLSKGVQVSVSLAMISDEALATAEQIRMLSAWLAAHGISPDDVMHILVPRTMCHDLRVARSVAAATIVSRVRDLHIASDVLSFADVIEPYLKWAKDRSLLPDGLSSASLYDRTPTGLSSRTCPQAKEYEVALETGTPKRRRFVSSLVESHGLLFVKDQKLASRLKNSCVDCAGRSGLLRERGCVEALSLFLYFVFMNILLS